MKFTTQAMYKIRPLFLIALLLQGMLCFSQARQIPVTSPENRAVLENHDSRAQAFVAKNLNRFGLEKLIDYDKALDSLNAQEIRDTLDLLEKNYVGGSSKLLNDIHSQDAGIKELTDEKAEIEIRYNRLIKLAGFSFLGWLVIVILFLQFQKRKVGKEAAQLAKTEVQLKGLESTASGAASLIDQLKSSKNAFHKFKEDSEVLQQTCREIAELPASSAEWSSEIVPSVDKIAIKSRMEFGMAQIIMSQEPEPGDDKTATDINKLCDEVFEITRRGAGLTDDFNCQVTKDFEKNLPSVQVNQAAVSNMLFNVLDNAFNSVRAKNAKGTKGYQPKVGISTRILPRFLQVRVRDNGTGMPEAVLQQATNEFYSTNEEKAGLGLSISHNTMIEKHKGELRLESEDGNSADVYIKFFVK